MTTDIFYLSIVKKINKIFLFIISRILIFLVWFFDFFSWLVSNLNPHLFRNEIIHTLLKSKLDLQVSCFFELSL